MALWSQLPSEGPGALTLIPELPLTLDHIGSLDLSFLSCSMGYTKPGASYRLSRTKQRIQRVFGSQNMTEV